MPSIDIGHYKDHPFGEYDGFYIYAGKYYVELWHCGHMNIHLKGRCGCLNMVEKAAGYVTQ